ncbi:MAG: VWA domain-containing protein [Candidatus Kapabacteria bacterium]|nr:VWA domain-containing protein [Candidatus Kapabacteria bacterium]
MLLRVPTDITTPCFTLCARLVVIMRFIATPFLRTRSSACAPLGCYFLLIAFLVVGSFSPLGAQSLSFFFDSASAAYNAQNFPRMRASVRAFDARGQQITSKLDFRLAEDGVQRTVADYVCPTQQAKPVSAVLTIDISGSMGVPFNGTTRLKIAQEAANAFVGALATDGSECGIVAFETNSYPFQDFTTDKGRLTQVVNGLSPLNGTNYQLAFSGNPGGALTMLERAKNSNRAVIFLTDGLSTANYNQVIQQAKQVGATVYCITIGFPVPPVLDTIARATGGEAFSNVQSKDEAIQIYRELANRIRLNTPCVVEWTTDLPCRSEARSVVLTAPSLGVSASLSYMPQQSLTRQVRIVPPVLSFGSVPANTTTQPQNVSLQLAAGAQNLTIRRFISSDPTVTITTMTPLPLTAGGARVDVSLVYKAQDSGYKFATVTAETQDENGRICSFDWYITAGFPGARPKVPTLELIRPNGGEVFLVGTTASIAWRGVPPTEPVILDVSIDAGKTWRNVDSNATGNVRPWLVPNTPSDNCLMRVRQKNSSVALFSNDSSIVINVNGTNARTAQFGANPRASIVAAVDRLYVVWNDSLRRITNTGLNSEASQINDVTINGFGDIAYTLANNSGDNAVFSSPSFNQFQRVDFSAGGRASPNSIRFNPTNPRELVISNADTEQSDINIYTINASVTGVTSILLPRSRGSIRNVIYTPDGRGIIAAAAGNAGSDGGVRLWDISTRPFIAPPFIWSPQIGINVIYVEAVQQNGVLLIAATCSDGKVRFLRVVNTGSTPVLQEDPALTPLPSFNAGAIRMASFDRTGTFLITAMENGSAQIWSVASGQLITALQHETNTTGVFSRVVNTAFFDQSTSRAVTAGENGKVILWYLLEKLPLQEDRSNNLWRIVRPHLQARDIDVGQAIVGNDKDTTDLALTNPDLYPVPVTKVWFKKANSPFSIVSGGAPFTVNAATPPRLGLYNIEFRFHPLVEGRGVENTDSVFFQTIAGDTLRARISGEGVLQRIQISTQSIDWRERFVNIGYDTVQAVVRNVSTVPVTFSLPTVPNVSGTFIPAFSILGVTLSPRSTNNGGIITLAVGDSIVVNLRFTAPYLGLIGAPLQFITNQPGEPPTVQLLGTGVQAGPRLSSTITALPMVQTLCTQPQPQDIPLPNTGTQALVIDSMRVVGADGLLSRDFQILTQTPLTIQVNDQGSQSARLRFTPQAVGTTFATLIVYSNSISGVARIPLQGRLEQPILKLSRRFIPMEPIDAGQTRLDSIRVENIGNFESGWYPVPSLSQRQLFRLIANPADATLSSNANASLRFTFLGGQPGVTYQDIFIIDNKCSADTITLSATVHSAPRLQTSITSISLPTCASSATINIPITNTGTAPARMSYAIEPPTRLVSRLVTTGTIGTGETVTVQVILDTLARAGALPTFSLIAREASTASISVPITITKYDVVGIDIIPSSVPFPVLDAGVATSAVVLIRNRSNQTLTIPTQASNRTQEFRLETPSQTIPPYGEVAARLIFTGASAGLSFVDSFPFAVSVAGVNGCAASNTLLVSASTLPPSTADLVFENFYAAPGDTAQTKVFLRNRARVPIGTVITDTIRYNVSLLQPLSPLPFGEVWLGERKIPVSFEIKSDDPTVPLATLRFRAALGNDTSTVLRLQKTPETRVPKMTINASTATFRLVGISRAGGLRLVIATMGTLHIVDARPNPASTELTLEFTSHDAEEYTLNLINALGVRPDPMLFAEQRFTSMRGLNTRVLDVSRLPSGIYFIQLRNGRELAARKVIIVR